MLTKNKTHSSTGPRIWNYFKYCVRIHRIIMKYFNNLTYFAWSLNSVNEARKYFYWNPELISLKSYLMKSILSPPVAFLIKVDEAIFLMCLFCSHYPMFFLLPDVQTMSAYLSFQNKNERWLSCCATIGASAWLRRRPTWRRPQLLYDKR